jgi:hypothetical protein
MIILHVNCHFVWNFQAPDIYTCIIYKAKTQYTTFLLKAFANFPPPPSSRRLEYWYPATAVPVKTAYLLWPVRDASPISENSHRSFEQITAKKSWSESATD